MTQSETSVGIDLIAAERQRQVEQEGWTPEHDDGHASGALAWAAACYAAPARIYRHFGFAAEEHFRDPWPWTDQWDKRKKNDLGQTGNVPEHIPTKGAKRVRLLVMAGALIAAEIDRLLRAHPDWTWRG